MPKPSVNHPNVSDSRRRASSRWPVCIQSRLKLMAVRSSNDLAHCWRATYEDGGITLDFGLSHTNISEVTIKQAMIRSAREVILLADIYIPENLAQVVRRRLKSC